MLGLLGVLAGLSVRLYAGRYVCIHVRTQYVTQIYTHKRSQCQTDLIKQAHDIRARISLRGSWWPPGCKLSALLGIFAKP